MIFISIVTLLVAVKAALYNSQNITLLNYTYLAMPVVHPMFKTVLNSPFDDEEYKIDKAYF